MVAAHRRVIDTNVVVRQAPDGVALLVHVVFRRDGAIETQNQPSHVRLASGRAEPAQHLVEYSTRRRERFHDLRRHHRDVILATIVVTQLNQLLSGGLKVSTKGAYG